MSFSPQKLADTVVSWLNYKSNTGLGDLFSEASLSVPIGGYLAANYNGVVKAEENHPIFHNMDRGRNRQVDFVLKSQHTGKWHAAIECKFVNTSFRAIVDDLCRLVCLSQEKSVGGPKRYFILVDRISVSRSLLGNRMNNNGGARILAFNQILSSEQNMLHKDLGFRIGDLRPRQRLFFKRFLEHYGRSGVKLPSSIRTRLCALSSFGQFTCGIWQVSAMQNATLLVEGDFLN